MRRAAVAALVTLGLLLPSSAWGGQSNAGGPGVVEQAAVRLLAAGSSRMTIALRMAAVPGAPSGRFEVAAGLIEFSTGRAHYSVDPSGIVGTAGASPLEIATDGDTTFVRVGDGHAGTWVPVSQDVLASFTSGLPAGDVSGPGSALSLLRYVSGPVTTHGTETVRGTSTTRYDFTLALGDRGQSFGSAASDAPPSRVAPVTTRMDAMAWIDNADGRLRRLRIIVDLGKVFSATSPQLRGKFETEVEFFDFGTPVGAVLPSPSELLQTTAATREQLLAMVQQSVSP